MSVVESDVRSINWDKITLSDMERLNKRGIYIYFKSGRVKGYEYNGSVTEL